MRWAVSFVARSRSKILGAGLVVAAVSGGACTKADSAPDEAKPGARGAGPVVATQIAGSHSNACATMSDGSVRCWGGCAVACTSGAQADAGPVATVPNVSDAVEVAVGDSFACAREAGGAVRCWGDNVHRSLGRAASTIRRGSAQVVEGLPPVAEIVAGTRTMAARTSDGKVWGWGWTLSPADRPAAVVRQALPHRAKNVPAATSIMSVGSERFCARTNSGWSCWQGAEWWQGDTMQFDERPLPPLRGDAVAADEACGCVLTAAGHLSCSAQGMPGPADNEGNSYAPTLGCSTELDDVTAFAVPSAEYGCAIRTKGTIGCWGERNGTYVPAWEVGLPHAARQIVAAPRGATVVLDAEGTVWQWGGSRSDAWKLAPDQSVTEPYRVVGPG